MLTSRLIDRPMRPLFPDGFYNEVQVDRDGACRSNPEIDSDIPAMIGASAALALSGIPFDGPIGAARVGYVDGQYVLNPTKTELEDVAARTSSSPAPKPAVLMVESEAQRAARGRDARRRGVRPRADAGRDRARSTSSSTRPASRCGTGRPPAKDEALIDEGHARWPRAICSEAYRMRRSRRASRSSRRSTQQVLEAACVPADATPGRRATSCNDPVRPRSEDRPQPDPRRRAAHRRPRHAHRAPDLHPHRRAAAHPRLGAVHARRDAGARRRRRSAPRATSRSSTRCRASTRERFMLHYNFPPYATGETGRVGSPKRREIGHGRLAKRALLAVLPTGEEFALLDARRLGDHRVERLARRWRRCAAAASR